MSYIQSPLMDENGKFTELYDNLLHDTLILEEEVAWWGDTTFPKGSEDSVLNHLGREYKEFVSGDNKDEEAADIVLLLIHYAHKRGFSLFDAVREKFNVNKNRKWKAPDEFGVVEHEE